MDKQPDTIKWWQDFISGDISAGSNTVNNVVLVGQPTLEIGQAVTGLGIPIGTTVTQVVGNTVTLSANATQSLTASDDGLAIGAPKTTIPIMGIENQTVNLDDGDDVILDPADNTAILGGPGNDTIIIDATFGNGVTVDGGEDADTIIIQLGNIDGPVTISDSGTAGITTIKIVGSDADEQMTLSATQFKAGNQVVMLDLSSGNTNLILDGGEGDNQVTIEGSLPDGVTTTLQSLTQTVQIDVKPDSDDNTANAGSNGVITVALFATDSFDVADVEIASVLFAGAGVWQSAFEDVDGDGDLDLLMHFRVADTDLDAIYQQLLAEDLNGDGVLDSNKQLASVSLTGETTDGTSFLGDETMNLFLSGKALREALDQIFAE